MEELLQELADVVESAPFKAQQDDFYSKYASEFELAVDEGTTNKLAWTTIHKEYVETTEATLLARLGDEKLGAIIGGMEAYLKSDHSKEARVAAAIDALTSMSDYEDFKAMMLSRKQAIAEGTHVLSGLGDVAIIDMAEAMEKAAALKEASASHEGWTELINNETLAIWMKPGKGKDTIMHSQINIEMPCAFAADCIMNLRPECMEWRADTVNSIEIVRDYGPDDALILMAPKVPFVMRYLMSMPEKIPIRLVTKRDFPAPGDFSYIAVPYDIERNVAIEEVGPTKLKSGVFSPHPDNPNMTIVHSLDMANLSMIPTWGLKMILKAKVTQSIDGSVKQYKASSRYKNFIATNTSP